MKSSTIHNNMLFIILFLTITGNMCHLKWNETPEGCEDSHICSFSYTVLSIQVTLDGIECNIIMISV